MRRLLILTTLLALLLVVGSFAQAQEKAKPKSGAAKAGKHHVLKATKETVQWGFLDPKEPPKLTVDSGDTVSIETWYHALDVIKPDLPMEEIVRLRKVNSPGGPHSVTGPIYVNGAEPGDVMEVRILKIVPKEYGQNFNLPGKEFPTVGLLASEFPEGFVHYYKLDVAKMQTELKPGITIDLQPFPGILAVGVDPNEPKEKAGPPIHDAKGRTSTLRPWKNGSNMDLNELQAGSTLYAPVFLKGGLIWVGDAHCRQGNGEVNLEALECAFKEIEIQPIVRKDMKLDWPRAETKTHWITMGFDEDLTEAMKIAVRQTVDLLTSQKMVPITREEAYALASMMADCRVTQMVDVRKGVHCMLPKSLFAQPAGKPPVPAKKRD